MPRVEISLGFESDRSPLRMMPNFRRPSCRRKSLFGPTKRINDKGGGAALLIGDGSGAERSLPFVHGPHAKTSS